MVKFQNMLNTILKVSNVVQVSVERSRDMRGYVTRVAKIALSKQKIGDLMACWPTENFVIVKFQMN